MFEITPTISIGPFSFRAKVTPSGGLAFLTTMSSGTSSFSLGWARDAGLAHGSGSLEALIYFSLAWSHIGVGPSTLESPFWYSVGF